MVVSKSVAVSYRSLQAIADLRAVAGSASRETLNRLVAGLNGRVSATDLDRLIGAAGCRLSDRIAEAAHPALLLAATLPDDDYEAFRVSTAILLADRLQQGAGDDDLFWHWDAFQAHYRTLPDADRAAVLQGYRQLQVDGLIALFDPPEGDWVTTETGQRVHMQLQPLLRLPIDEFAARIAGLCAAALDASDAVGRSAVAWGACADRILALPDDERAPLVRAIRHIYESAPEWQPHDGVLFDPSENLPAMIPALPLPR